MQLGVAARRKRAEPPSAPRDESKLAAHFVPRPALNRRRHREKLAQVPTGEPGDAGLSAEDWANLEDVAAIRPSPQKGLSIKDSVEHIPEVAQRQGRRSQGSLDPPLAAEELQDPGRNVRWQRPIRRALSK